MTEASTTSTASASDAQGEAVERGLLASPAFWIGGALSALFWVLIAVAVKNG